MTDRPLNVDLHLRRGAFELVAKFDGPMTGITVVFGPSGAGKSMLLAAIAGLAKPDAGRIAIGEEVLDDVAVRLHVPAYKRGIGLVFQDARLFPHLTVRGNLMYASRRAEPSQSSIEETAAAFDIAEKLDRPVRNLSGGEKARVALARALRSRSRLLLLDEPFASLDGPRRRAFLKLIMDVSAQAPVPLIVVTHQIDDAAELADRMLVMREGRLVASGDAGDVLNQPELRALLDPRDIGARASAWMLKGDNDAAASGNRARGAWIRADSVLLAVEEPRGLSARNVWPGEISELEPEADGSLLATLKLGTGYILSRITRAAAEELKLRVGSRAWAVVKAHAI